MPVKTGKDSNGCYAQWGSQKKYYYPCGDSKAMARAKLKAAKQGAAVRATGWTEADKEEDYQMTKKIIIESDSPLENYEYLIHHIEVNDKGVETIHHCYLYDHLCNLFEQEHLVVNKGKVYFKNKVIKEGVFHIITGLEPTQEVCWNDEQAEEVKIKPKQIRSGMTFKEKAKEW